MKRKLKMLSCLLIAVFACSLIQPVMTGTAVYAAEKVEAKKSIKKVNRIRTGISIVSCPEAKNKYTMYKVKFKAPKKGTYKFTFGYCGSGKEGYFQFFKKNGKLFKAKKFTTSKGKRYFTPTISSRVHSTYGKIKLKKGQTIYIVSAFKTKSSYKYDVTVKRQ